MITSAVYNSSYHRKKGSKSASPEDYMPKKPKTAQTPERMALLLKAITVAMGGEIESAS